MTTQTAESVRMQALESAVQDIRDAVGQIAEAMNKIARLEERHQETRESLSRAFDRIEKLEGAQSDARVELVEIRAELKPLQETRGWMVKAMLSTIGFVAMAVIGLVVKTSGG